MTVPAFHVEAKLHAFRKTQDGVVVSFVVSPIDMPQALALDPLGTRYMLALAQIGDDEQPVSPAGTDQPRQHHKGMTVGGAGQQTGTPTPAGDHQRQRYAAMSPAEQAVTRAAMLPKDERFRAWVAHERWNGKQDDMASEHTAIEHIRERCCGGNSRKMIADIPEYMDRFLALETSFRMDVGELPRPR